ncbi:MAG: metal ABC transporter ATP-binding protein [Halocynthiibacter sp.]
MSLVSVENISVTLGGTEALSNVSLAIEPAEITTVIGPNGSGKSTLMRAVMGIITPQSGRIRRKAGLKIGYVPQKLHVDPGLPLTVGRFLDLPKPADAARVADVLKTVGADHLQKRQITALSGGQLQRVLLARAILEDPDLLILDEATQGLDQQGSANFYDLVATLRRDMGCAILMVSHELHVVMSASDHVLCLNGHVCCHGAPETVASAPEYRALFGTGTHGALALYRHEHQHSHDGCDHDHTSLEGSVDA